MNRYKQLLQECITVRDGLVLLRDAFTAGDMSYIARYLCTYWLSFSLSLCTLCTTDIINNNYDIWPGYTAGWFYTARKIFRGRWNCRSGKCRSGQWRRKSARGGQWRSGFHRVELSWAAALPSCSRTERLKLTWKTHIFCNATRRKVDRAWALNNVGAS